jgi:hypothetical protein
MTTATAVTLDRELIERLIVELDGVAHFDSFSNAGNETLVQSLIYGITEQLERAAFGRMSEDEDNRLYERGVARGRELAREHFGAMLEQHKEVVVDAD